MYIYIVTHPKFEGWIKLGRTNDPKRRLNDYQTNCPDFGYKLEYSIATEYYYNIETYFDNYIAGNKREWYKCSVLDAINTINKILADIKIDPKYLTKNDTKYYQRKIIQKKSNNNKVYDYLVDEFIFNSIRELSVYVRVKMTAISKQIYYNNKNNITEFYINGYKITRRKHENKNRIAGTF